MAPAAAAGPPLLLLLLLNNNNNSKCSLAFKHLSRNQDTFNFIPGSQLRDEFNTVSATASTTSHHTHGDATFTFRGPQLDLSAVPDAERQFAEAQLDAAKQADEKFIRARNQRIRK